MYLTEGQTCSSRVADFLARISEHSDLNAFVEVYGEEAIARAEALDQKRATGQPLGRLHGLVCSIKDVIAYQDHKLSAASKMLEGYTSLYSSTVVERILSEDAIIIGRTNCDEFAMGSDNRTSHHGPVKNLIDKTRVPGGSSGGAAVSVQLGGCDVAIASDTGGSVRQPASFCGVVGFKPSYGRISRHGLIAYGSSFDQIGLIAEDLALVAAVYDVIQGQDEYDYTLVDFDHDPTATTLSTVGVLQNALDHEALNQDVGNSIQSLVVQLTADGIATKQVNLDLLDYVIPSYYVLASAEASSNLSRYDGVRYGYRAPASGSLDEMYSKSRTAGFGDEVKRRIMLGTFVLSYGYYDQFFGKAQRVRRLIRDQLIDLLKDIDVLILPTAPGVAWGLDEVLSPVEMYLGDIYSVLANLAGLPAVSIPLGTNADGLPFGLQLIGAPYAEKKLLSLSKDIMSRLEKR